MVFRSGRKQNGSPWKGPPLIWRGAIRLQYGTFFWLPDFLSRNNKRGHFFRWGGRVRYRNCITGGIRGAARMRAPNLNTKKNKQKRKKRKLRASRRSRPCPHVNELYPFESSPRQSKISRVARTGACTICHSFLYRRVSPHFLPGGKKRYPPTIPPHFRGDFPRSRESILCASTCIVILRRFFR